MSHIHTRPSKKPPKAWLSLSAIKFFPTGHQSPWMHGSEAGQRLLVATGSGPGFEFGEAPFCRQLQWQRCASPPTVSGGIYLKGRIQNKQSQFCHLDNVRGEGTGEDRPSRAFSCFMPTEFSQVTLKKYTCTLTKVSVCLGEYALDRVIKNNC